jgi:transcriptional regulator with XRE-family HTH domain
MSKYNNIEIKLGYKIRYERLKQKLSQEKLAEKANLHRTFIGAVERGEVSASIGNIAKIAEALNLEIEDLLNFQL